MDPADGDIVLNFADGRVGTIAKYFCSEGFVLVGDATRCCVGDDETAEWMREDEPTCVRKLYYLVLNSCFL